MRSRSHKSLSTFHFPLSTRSFTMIEMLVVLGIVGMVAAITLPMLIPMMRTRTLDSAVDTVKSACNLARSTAIQQRKLINLTFLQQTDATHGPGIVLTGYNFAGTVTASSDTLTDLNQNWTANAFQHDQVVLFSTGQPPQIRKIQSNSQNTITIYGQGGQVYNPADPNDPPPPYPRDWSPAPIAGNVYVILSAASPAQPYCIHYLGNYTYYNNSLANSDVRFLVLKTFSLYMGETIQYLPTGCQFTFCPAWSSSVSYTAGNMVSDKGADYYCNLANTNSEPPNSNWQVLTAEAWTYVFLPDGEVWTLTTLAQDLRDTNWLLTTCMANGQPSGPKIWGPQNETSATIVVYATTGQVVSQ